MAGEPVGNRSQRRTAAEIPGSAVTAKEGEAVTVAAANTARRSLTVCNDGAKTVYLFKGAGAEAHKGIRLNAEGGAVVIDDYTGIVTVRTAEGESLVTVTEV